MVLFGQEHEGLLFSDDWRGQEKQREDDWRGQHAVVVGGEGEILSYSCG